MHQSCLPLPPAASSRMSPSFTLILSPPLPPFTTSTSRVYLLARIRSCPPREDLVVLSVADTLEDLVVVAGPVAGFDLAQDQLVCGESRGPDQGHHHHHQSNHHRQLAHAPLLSRTWGDQG